jgi:hypothetical protein
MDGKLRNMTGLYLMNQGKMLLLYRVGSKDIQVCHIALKKQ